MKSIYIFILASLSATSLFATHNKSGEIQYRQIGEKTIQCYIITYTDPISVPADRDSLEVNWGDGMTEWVVRTNGNGDGELISNRFQHNIYVSTHTYKSFGEYTLSIDDSNRNDGILNINNGNSNIFSFYVFNTFTLDAEYNSSPQPLLPSIAVASIFTPFEHVAAAFDDDGDQLTYKLVTPKTEGGVDIENYQLVTEIGNAGANQISLNPVTGHLVWDTPAIPGIYNISIEITSFRNGIQNGTFVRDMIIEVSNEEIPAPLISQTGLLEFGAVQEVMVGDTILLEINATGQNNLETLMASSGLFDFSEGAASFDLNVSTNSEQSGQFFWVVDPTQIRDEAYHVAFQANNDNLIADYYLIRYKVNALDTSTPFISEKNHDIEIFPNPSSDFIIIDMGHNDFSEFQILSVDGKIWMHSEISSYSIDIRSLIQGTYFLLLDNKYVAQFCKI